MCIYTLERTNNMHLFKHIFFWILLCRISVSFGQVPDTESLFDQDSLSLREPAAVVYLQPSKGVYEAGEMVWFKGYAMDAHMLTPYAGDTTLYVQLVSVANRTPVLEAMVPAAEGFASGYLQLTDSVAPGDYYLMGATRSSFYRQSADFRAFRRIRVLPSRSTAMASRTAADGHSPTAGDTVPFRVTFYPEGGHLVSGVPATVGFRAESAGQSGSLPVSGRLLADGQEVARFKSIHRGMGRFDLVPRTGVHYEVVLDKHGGTATFPEVLPAGVTMRLADRYPDAIRFTVAGSPGFLPDGNSYVSVQHRGLTVAAQRFHHDEETFSFRIPTDSLPEGIVEVTLYDGALTPLCERLVYVNSHRRLRIEAVPDDSVYAPGDLVRLRVRATDEAGNPVAAHLGLSVWDGYYGQGDGLGMLSYNHLYTQLATPVANPAYYYKEGKGIRADELDLVLLTVGWRGYVWNRAYLQDKDNGGSFLPDGVTGHTETKRELPPALLPFTAEGAMYPAPVPVGPDGTFRFGTEHLALGSSGYFYVRPMGSNEASDAAKLAFGNPFDAINGALAGRELTPLPFGYRGREVPVQQTARVPRQQMLQEVVVSRWGAQREFKDRYMENLDSIAKFSFVHDHVGECGWLNCADCGMDRRPVEGEVYTRYKDPGRIPRHNVSFTADEVIKEPYHYPEYTDEELLELFNIYRVQGYQPEKQFYEPGDAGGAGSAVLPDDFRSTLVWRPWLITDERGEAVVEFYASAVTGVFIGNVEGIDGSGLLGEAVFELTVLEDEK